MGGASGGGDSVWTVIDSAFVERSFLFFWAEDFEGLSAFFFPLDSSTTLGASEGDGFFGAGADSTFGARSFLGFGTGFCEFCEAFSAFLFSLGPSTLRFRPSRKDVTSLDRPGCIYMVNTGGFKIRGSLTSAADASFLGAFPAPFTRSKSSAVPPNDDICSLRIVSFDLECFEDLSDGALDVAGCLPEESFDPLSSRFRAIAAPFPDSGGVEVT